MLSLIQATMAMETREVVLLLPKEKCPEWANASERLVDCSVPITKIETQDIKTKNDALTVSLPILSMMEGFKLDGVHPHRYTIPFGAAHTHMYNMMENPLLLAGEKQFQLTVTTPYSGLIVFITGD